MKTEFKKADWNDIIDDNGEFKDDTILSITGKQFNYMKKKALQDFADKVESSYDGCKTHKKWKQLKKQEGIE